MMAAEIRDPTGDTGTGAGVTVKETQRHSIMGAARYLVADVVEGQRQRRRFARGVWFKHQPPPPRWAENLGRWIDGSGSRYVGVERTMDWGMGINICEAISSRQSQ